MTPLQLAQQEWVVNTKLHCKDHYFKNRKWAWTDEFRKCGQAIALINWDGEDIEITKMEKLPDAGRGAAIPLVKSLKTLADKYHVRIFGHVKPYTPDPPWPVNERIPTQEELEVWYEKQGFHLRTRGEPGAVALWYPDVPRL